jgi:Asp-tRNA(Asn)/Glu-tRNA(Gln) amidotransferase A subunit family amidase
LAGSRLSLKDIFDVRGVKTTLSSKAWAELYPEPQVSAQYVDHLLDLGVVIVGKTKATQFSTAMEWIDFQSPTNPRGDRYQEPSGSSTGAAASLAGYNWLDYAIGGDCESHEKITLRPAWKR